MPLDSPDGLSNGILGSMLGGQVAVCHPPGIGDTALIPSPDLQMSSSVTGSIESGNRATAVAQHPGLAVGR